MRQTIGGQTIDGKTLDGQGKRERAEEPSLQYYFPVISLRSSR